MGLGGVGGVGGWVDWARVAGWGGWGLYKKNAFSATASGNFPQAKSHTIKEKRAVVWRNIVHAWPFLFIYPSTSLAIYISICLTTHQSMHLFILRSIYPCLPLCVSAYVYIYICLPSYISIMALSIYISIDLSLYLSM